MMPSTAIDWVHWKDGVLSVKYRDGDAYDYLGVSEEVYRSYKATLSKGQFVNAVIKPNYEYRKRPH